MNICRSVGEVCAAVGARLDTEADFVMLQAKKMDPDTAPISEILLAPYKVAAYTPAKMIGIVLVSEAERLLKTNALGQGETDTNGR